jgi:SAM-dependent methyltransferase
MAAHLDMLHAPYEPLLAAALFRLSPDAVGSALDLGCGPGRKTGWLARHLCPGGRLLAVDIDRAALRRAAVPGRFLAADAAALPLRDASVALVWCVAALHAFADPAAALQEVRRVIQPGGTLIVTSVTQRWMLCREWPAALARACVDLLPVAADEPACDLERQVQAAGFTLNHSQAFLLDAADLITASLPPADWFTLRPLVAGRLSAADLAACDAIAAEEIEPELVNLLLLVAAGLPVPANPK